MIKGTPITAETIHINHPEASYGIFCFNEQGDLFVNSDYGFYGFAWRSYGDRTFREFLCGVNPDYMADKFELNYITTTGKAKGISKYWKEKLVLLCELFIKTLNEQPAPVQKQELVTRLYNLKNQAELALNANINHAALVLAVKDADETLKKVIQ